MQQVSRLSCDVHTYPDQASNNMHDKVGYNLDIWFKHLCNYSRHAGYLNGYLWWNPCFTGNSASQHVEAMTPWPASAKHRERSHLGSNGCVEWQGRCDQKRQWRSAAMVTWITWMAVWPYSFSHSGWLWIQKLGWNCKSQSVDILHGFGMIQVWDWTAPNTRLARWCSYWRRPFSSCPTVHIKGGLIFLYRCFTRVIPPFDGASYNLQNQEQVPSLLDQPGSGSSMSHFWTQMRESNPQKNIEIL